MVSKAVSMAETPVAGESAGGDDSSGLLLSMDDAAIVIIGLWISLWKIAKVPGGVTNLVNRMTAAMNTVIDS
jgi:hypothetical protein